ncbi:hypothetical protein [Methanosarcina mazei]|uniref:hypothetical protein n=1 Tax=Methanosarcina mazei TaxID=2209 RepID=UPI0012D420C9|nr:hypothetical protein [Methanosarcina mazei]
MYLAEVLLRFWVEPLDLKGFYVGLAAHACTPRMRQQEGRQSTPQSRYFVGRCTKNFQTVRANIATFQGSSGYPDRITQRAAFSFSQW